MNETANNPAKCPRCGAELPANAPEGLCPRCIAANLAETEVKGAGPGGTVIVNPAPASPPPSVEEIAKLFPQLEILELLGRGGMGAVYKARQPRLGRFVALKILAGDKKGDAHFAERFEREARTLAFLHHPNIVAIYDFGETQGNFYLLMEFVDGLTLRQLLQTRKLSADEALAIVPKICEALQYAHKQGIVHRDIKPENILLDKQGQVKIADFGIAKIVGEQAQAGLTQEQQVIGTPHYMAPEQVERPKTVDHRADIYSLGVVLYEMLTNELPLGKFSPPSRKVQVDVRLDEVVLHALEKEPERRYQEANQVKTDVEAISSGGSAKISVATPLAGSGEVLTDETILPAFLLAFFFGVFGAHRFYVGKIWTGLAQLGAWLWCVLLIIGCAINSWPGQPTLAILLAFSICGCGVAATIDWILIVCKAFRDGDGRRITEWVRPKTASGHSSGTPPNYPPSHTVPPVNPPPQAPDAGVSAATPPPPGTSRVAVPPKIAVPAVALIIVGVLKLCTAIVGMLFLLGIIENWNGSLDFDGWVFPFSQNWSLAASANVIFFNAIPGLLILFGARQMLRLRSYAWATVAAALSVVAWSIVGLPAGIWALIILAQPEVHRAFENASIGSQRKRGLAPVLAGIAATAAMLLIGGILAAVLAGAFSNRTTIGQKADFPIAARSTNALIDDSPALETDPDGAAVTDLTTNAGPHLFHTGMAPNFTKTFSVAPGGKLILKADRGNVHVKGGTGNSVEVRVTRRVTRADAATAAQIIRDHRIELQQSGRNISITARGPSFLKNLSLFTLFRWPNLEVDYEITVPEQFDVELATAGGNVELADASGLLKAETMGGNVVLNGDAGDLTAKTMGGSIHAGDCKAALQLSTEGGNVTIERFSGSSVRGGTSGGSIHVDFAEAPTEDCDLHTSGGSVSAKIPSSAKLTVDAQTAGGSVRSDLPIEAKNKYGNATLHGTLNGGGPVLKLRTMGGNIEVARR